MKKLILIMLLAFHAITFSQGIYVINGPTNCRSGRVVTYSLSGNADTYSWFVGNSGMLLTPVNSIMAKVLWTGKSTVDVIQCWYSSNGSYHGVSKNIYIIGGTELLLQMKCFDFRVTVQNTQNKLK